MDRGGTSQQRRTDRNRFQVVNGGTGARDETDALLDRALDGDAGAWRRIYESHFESLLRHIAYATGDVSLAEDLAQESFAIALVRLPSFDGGAPFISWMRGIAHNLVRKHWRKRGRRTRAYNHLEQIAERIGPLSADEPDRALLQRDRAEALLAVLDTLPDSLREAFVLSDVQGLSAAEAATITGTTAGNLRVRAARARARMRTELRRLGFFEEHA